MDIYQAACAAVWFGIDLGGASFLIFICWCILKFEGLRKKLWQAADNGDEIFHFVDSKNVILLICGIASGIVTFNLVMLFVTFRMFEAGPGILVGFMTGVTGGFLGVSLYKKGENPLHP